MKIGLTGGTGFIGSHLVDQLAADDHRIVLVSRSGSKGNEALQDHPGTELFQASITDREALRTAFADCDRIIHLAGINIERGTQTYDAVHVRGTKNVVAAAKDGDASKILLSSFLRARPNCGSAYHESKWQAEQIVRNSEMDYTIFKPGITYGPGDHMLDHLSRALSTVPVFPTIGFAEHRLRPLAIADLVDCLVASAVDNKLSKATVGVVGPEEVTLREMVRRVGTVLGKNPLIFPLPVFVHYALAQVQERVLEIPITTVGQIRILAEGASEPAPTSVCEPLTDELEPTRSFSKERIADGITTTDPYGFSDLRW
ncbi:NAD(P)H-binding protein [Haloarcula sp. H-GB4]|uniref:SDR family oxidoreductase n=1 Tax=Haloarcula sp. H-GB4 TaxID=3069755 RepID=UPI0027B2E98E|nr:NAD(P)H-binding protein [Haloarcula sp. H-GB4]MDQ2074801.1 NAD(P)H-binding protein [Haloarcula sp. H-GB4]